MILSNFNYDTLSDANFPEISQTLLNKCLLVANKQKFRLVEIEFYLYSPNHSDPYVHQDPDQLLLHTFYFHKFKTGTYKSGTFKGMDFTFGNTDKKVYFGILIRAIQHIKTGQVIEGPCNVVNRILNSYQCDSIMDLTHGQNLGLFENDVGLTLVPSKSLEARTIYAGPRIGLSAKYPDYQNRSYRFVADKNLVKKQRSTLKEI